MKNVAGVFLDYFRLERKRGGAGLTVQELERWSAQKQRLDSHMRQQAGSRSARTSVRVRTRLHCAFASKSEFDAAVITNLSAGGVFVATNTPLPIGEKLRLKIHVASAGASIDVEGVVVSNNVGRGLDPGVAGMGVRFTGAGGETIDQIHDLYERELERETQPQPPASTSTQRPCDADRRAASSTRRAATPSASVAGAEREGSARPSIRARKQEANRV
jgi:uncharacterized protein (TIGR02266 family)